MNNTTVSREIFDGFSGLGRLGARGKTSCRLENFRVLDDGSLEKREGIRQVAALPFPVRGVYSFSESGKEVILAVSGDTLYRITEDGQVSFSACLESGEGEVGFFVYGGRLYLSDGVSLYLYEGESGGKRVHGYTPLYGKNWSPESAVDHIINEPINSLSPHVRIHYRVREGINQMYIGFKVEAIDWILADGVKLGASSYRLSAQGEQIFFDSVLLVTDVEISVTLPQESYRNSALSSCVFAGVYESFENSRVCFFGGSNPAELFVSTPVGAEELRSDIKRYPDSCGLYVPKGEEAFSFGMKEPISAVGRLLDRLLLFFPSSLWASEPLSEVEVGQRILFSPICGHLGCSAPHATVMTGASSPISVARSGVYRLKIDPDLLEECVADCLSHEVAPLWKESFGKHAQVCYHRRRDELWFCDAAALDGRIFVYSLERRMWYSYRGLAIDRLFAFDGGVGFVRNGGVFVFDEALSVDRLADGDHRIEAVFESGWFDFGSVEADKRLERLLLTASLEGGELSVLLDDGELLEEVTLLGEAPPAFGVYEQRLPTGRFCAARLRLAAKGASRERIYRAELLAQKGKK